MAEPVTAAGGTVSQLTSLGLEPDCPERQGVCSQIGVDPDPLRIATPRFGSCSWDSGESNGALLCCHEPLEARVALEGCERGVDSQPAEREVERHRQQRLKRVQCLLGLVRQQVEAHELVLVTW